jgi:hypothetical protein
MKRVDELRILVYNTKAERKRKRMGHILSHDRLMVTTLEVRMEWQDKKIAQRLKC